MSIEHPAHERRGRFDQVAEAATLLEQRRGNQTAAQGELAEAIGLHDEV